MDTRQIQLMQTQFDAMAQRVPDENIEFWFGRDLQEPFGYIRWESFSTAIARAISSCETTGFDPADHFRGVTKMVFLGSGAERSKLRASLINRRTPILAFPLGRGRDWARRTDQHPICVARA